MKKSLLLTSALAVCTLSAFAEVTQTVPADMTELDGCYLRIAHANTPTKLIYANGTELRIGTAATLSNSIWKATHVTATSGDNTFELVSLLNEETGKYVSRTPGNNNTSTNYSMADANAAGAFKIVPLATDVTPVKYGISGGIYLDGTTNPNCGITGGYSVQGHWLLGENNNNIHNYGSGASAAKWYITVIPAADLFDYIKSNYTYSGDILSESEAAAIVSGATTEATTVPGMIASIEQALVAAEWEHTLLLPVTSARQIVDGGKYIIAAYNHHWGTADNADKRFLKFENNQNKFVTAADATPESVIWTAEATEATCSSTGHGHSATVTLRHGDRYMKQHTNGNNPANATTTTNTDPCNKFEFFTKNAPSGSAAGNTYFCINYNYTGGRFEKGMWVSKDKNMGFGSQSDDSSISTTYGTDGSYWTTYFLIWHVIDTEDDLAKHAEGYMTERVASTATLGEGIGLYHLYSPEIDEMIAKKGSTTAVSQANLDAFTTAVANIQVKLNMPKEGTYLKFNGAENAGTLRARAVLFYTTAYSMSNNTPTVPKHMTVDKTHTTAGYSDEKAIMYLDGDHLLSYFSGYYLGLDADGYLMFNDEYDMAEGGNGNQPATIGVAPGTSNSATYQINFIEGSNHFGFHINGSGSPHWYGSRCPFPDNDADLKTTTLNEALHNWILTQVTELPVTLANDGYGSFYAPVAVSFTNDVTVYAATIDGVSITFSQVEAGTPIAPGTPVVLKGTADATVNATIHYDYDPAAAPAALTESTGSTEGISFFGKTAIEKLPESTDVYTFRPTSGSDNTISLSKVETGAILPVNTMLVTLPTDCPLINAETGTVNLSLSSPNYTTGLREIEAADARGTTRIYDLQGRRLAAPVRGVNIIDGRKVLVK